MILAVEIGPDFAVNLFKIWKLLIYSRKLFVIANAILGIAGIFSITGISFESIITGFYVIGNTYLESFTSLTHKLFNWLLNLLNRMVPKVPDIPTPPIEPVEPSYPSYPNDYPQRKIPWYDDPKTANGYRLPELVGFDFPSKEWNISTWLLYAGAAIVTVGAVYLGYVYINDYFFSSVVKITPATPPTDPTLPPLPPSPLSSDGSTFFTTMGHKINGFINPFKWFNTDAQLNSQFNNFMERQFNPATHNNQLYPFTVENPYAPWYKKLTTAILGESKADEAIRMGYKDFAYRDFDVIRVGVHSPYVGTVGLGINSPSDWNNLLRLNSLPPTPTHSPTLPAIDLPDITGWKEHIPVNEVATSSKVTVEVLDKIVDEVARNQSSS
jgi:hypothetical protein